MIISINNKITDHEISSLNISQVSSLLSDKGGDVFIDLEFPITTKNKRIFDFSHRPNVVSKNIFDVKIEVGSMHFQGIGYLKKVADTYSLSIGFNNSDFFAKIKNKKLQDLRITETIQFPSSCQVNSGSAPLSIDESNQYFLESVKNPNSFEMPVLWQDRINTLSSINAQSDKIVFLSAGTYDIALSGSFIMEDGNDLFLEFYKKRITTITGTSTTVYTIINKTPFFAKALLTNSGTLTFPISSPLIISLTVDKGDEIFCGLLAKERRATGVLGAVAWCKYSVTNLNILISQQEQGTDLKMYATETYPTVKFCLAPVFNPEMLTSSDESEVTKYAFLPFQNYYDGSSFPLQCSIGSNTVRNVFTPFIYIAHIIDRIAIITGYTIQKNIFIQNPELSKLVFYNTFAQIEPDIDRKALYCALSWNISDNLPDMSISDFLGFLELFGAKIIADSHKKTLDIVFIKDILTQKINNEYRLLIDPLELETSYDAYELTMPADDDFASAMTVDLEDKNKNLVWMPDGASDIDNVGINSIYYSIKQRAYRCYAYDSKSKKLSWKTLAISKKKLSSKNETSRNIFTNESKISPILSGCLNTALTADDFEKIPSSLPLIYKTGVIGIAKKQGKVKNSFETLDTAVYAGISFYRGLKTVYDPETYAVLGSLPVLSHDVYDNRGIKYSDSNIALRLEGNYGLYETFWKPVIKWLCEDSRKVNIRIPYMSIGQYSKLNIHERIRINSQNYLIETLKTEITDTGVYNLDITAYTCY